MTKKQFSPISTITLKIIKIKLCDQNINQNYFWSDSFLDYNNKCLDIYLTEVIVNIP